MAMKRLVLSVLFACLCFSPAYAAVDCEAKPGHPQCIGDTKTHVTVTDSDAPPTILGSAFVTSDSGAKVLFEVGEAEIILLAVAPNQIQSSGSQALFFLNDHCEEPAYASARSTWSAFRLYRTEGTAAGRILWVEDGDPVEDFVMSKRGDQPPSFPCSQDGFTTSLITLVPLRNTGINLDTDFVPPFQLINLPE